MKIKFLRNSGLLSAAAILLLAGSPTKADQTSSTPASVNQEIQTFQSQLDTEISQANDLYSQASHSQQQISTVQGKISTLQSNIAASQEKYNSLKTVVSAQLRNLQENGGTATSIIDILTSSSNLTEMIARLSNLTIVMNAESAQAKELQQTKHSLETMRDKLVLSKSQLEQSQESYQSQVQALQSNISDLQGKISSNQDLLSEMQAKADSDALKEKTKLSTPSADKASTTSSSSTPAATEQTSASSDQTAQSSTTTPAKAAAPAKPVVPPTSSGRSLTVLATAYSSDNGLGYITAMGINLHQNPMCIAVDPSLIPLGSMVEIPGYGIAIAGDTGGAIIGNHIDVHLPTTSQAQAWGAKTITIQVLS